MHCIGWSIWSGKRLADLICCNLLEHLMYFQALDLLRSSGWKEVLTIRRLIIPSNMDLYCCFPPFKKVLQTYASRCRFATAVSRCFLSSHDLDFGSLNATRGPPLSSSQCQHFSPSRLLVTELNIDSDMVYRLCQRVTLQRFVSFCKPFPDVLLKCS